MFHELNRKFFVLKSNNDTIVQQTERKINSKTFFPRSIEHLRSYFVQSRWMPACLPAWNVFVSQMFLVKLNFPVGNVVIWCDTIFFSQYADNANVWHCLCAFMSALTKFPLPFPAFYLQKQLVVFCFFSSLETSNIEYQIVHIISSACVYFNRKFILWRISLLIHCSICYRIKCILHWSRVYLHLWHQFSHQT